MRALIGLLPILVSLDALSSVQKVDFFIDSNVLNQVSKEQVLSKITRDLNLGNEILARAGVVHERVVGSVEYFSSSNDPKLPIQELVNIQSWRETGRADSQMDLMSNDNPNRFLGFLDDGKENYKVFYVSRKGFSLACGYTYYTNQKKQSSFSWIHFDLTGQCGFDWLLSHELSHQDGLTHNEAQSCKKTTTLMASGFSGSRNTLSNGQYCQGGGSSISAYKSLGFKVKEVLLGK